MTAQLDDIHDYPSDRRYLAAMDRALQLASDRSNAMLGRNSEFRDSIQLLECCRSRPMIPLHLAEGQYAP